MSALITILAALAVGDDSHWTADGLPRLDVVSERAGRKVTREELTAAAPSFSRASPDLEQAPVDPAAPAPAPAPAASTVPAAPAPAPKAPVVAEPEPPAEDSEEAASYALQEALAEAELRVNSAKAHVAEAQGELSDAKKELDSLIVISEKERNTPENNQRTIQRFLASQQAQRAKTSALSRDVHSAVNAALQAPISRPKG